MHSKDKPMSDMISSVETVDAPEVAIDAGVSTNDSQKAEKKKSKAFPIIVAILSILIIGIGGYYLYNNYIGGEEESNENTASTEEIENEVVQEEGCEGLGETYEYDEELGEIDSDYLGSWHQCASVGSGYCARLVLFETGNYLHFPNYEDDGTPYEVEEGIWGIEDNQLNLAKEAEMDNPRSLSIGEIEYSPEEESPYSLKTTFGDTTYWLISRETDFWNSETGQDCQ